MTYDLRAGLQALHDAAPVPAVPVAVTAVRARVQRARALRTGATLLAAAAAVVGVAVTVDAAPWDAEPVPPAPPVPSETPAPTPTPTPMPEPEPEPFGAEAIEAFLVPTDRWRDVLAVGPVEPTTDETTEWPGLGEDVEILPSQECRPALLTSGDEAPEAYLAHEATYVEPDWVGPTTLVQSVDLLASPQDARAAFDAGLAAFETCPEYATAPPDSGGLEHTVWDVAPTTTGDLPTVRVTGWQEGAGGTGNRVEVRVLVDNAILGARVVFGPAPADIDGTAEAVERLLLEHVTAVLAGETPGQAGPDATPAPPPGTRLVALTTGGDIVVVDPTTGEQLDVVASGLPIDTANHSGLALSPDGALAYVNSRDPYEVLEVTLADGGVQVVGEGWDAAVSPDGTRLAFAGADDTAGFATGLWVTDVATLRSTHVPDEQAVGDVPRVVSDPAWSPDGTVVYVADGLPEARSLLAVDPSTTGTLGQARVVGPADDSLSWEVPEALPDGRLAVYVREWGYEPADASMHIAVVDPATGATTARVDVPGRWVVDLAAHPVDGSLAVVSGDGRLAIWDGTALRDVGAGYLAAGWHALPWL